MTAIFVNYESFKLYVGISSMEYHNISESNTKISFKWLGCEKKTERFGENEL